jgi:DNA-directed RNA polymerase sigma subunit (sigma70/sigma32)
VSRCVAEQGRVVRLPVHILDTMKRIKAARASLAQQQGRTSGLVTDEEVARVLSIPASKVAFYERVRV